MKTIIVDAVHCFVIKGQGIFEAMHDLLERYPNQKILATGADDQQMIDFGLHDMPYPVFTMKHNPEKSDPTYYTELLKHYNLQPGDVVYFEHAPEAVESARSIGITTYHYDSQQQDLEALKEFLDANT